MVKLTGNSGGSTLKDSYTQHVSGNMIIFQKSSFIVALLSPETNFTNHLWEPLALKFPWTSNQLPLQFYGIMMVHPSTGLVIVFFNPLTANDELSRYENLNFLWTWILRWVPRNFATHTSLSNTVSSNMSKNSENPCS